MATRIRLRRMGAKKAPFYRIVVADSRSPRDGRFIEEIGYYDPTKNPSIIQIDGERAKYWMGMGAQPSETVRTLMIRVGVLIAKDTDKTNNRQVYAEGSGVTQNPAPMENEKAAADTTEAQDGKEEQAAPVVEESQEVPEEPASVTEDAVE